ncbi:hypothetical protein JCM16418A_07970 [Paenibacillus pini]|uniref:HEAT repeat domain-containing protein n=1 Tax=Paenibacillus pini JCM 16418 TaxID=1236976 RepID=W7YGD3_9BACL|nr:hypothetical protein JCM16418_556 [Paenibacillus pini JCM 16418]
MLLKKLEESILNNKMDEVTNLLDEIVTQHDTICNGYLIEQLRTTENHLLRNQIALTLSDLKCQEVVDVIIELIQDPRTDGNRGTLIYALEPLNYLDHIDVLLNLCLTGNFEVKLQSLQLIKQVKGNIPKKIRKKYKERLKEEKEQLIDRKKFLKELKKQINN